MIILKSAFRKKTTKIYLFIVTCLFLAIGILLITRNHYIVEGNKNFEGSHFTFNAPLSEIEKIKTGENIKNVTVGLNREFSKEEGHVWSNCDIFVDKNIIGYEIKIWEPYVTRNNTPNFNKVTFINHDEKVEFNVKETYKSTGDGGNYISQEAFNNLYDGQENVIFRVEIEDYFKQNISEKWLEENINIDNKNEGNGISFTEISKSRNPLFSLYVTLFTFLSIGLGIVFIIILVYTIVNILIDEKKNSNLLKHLGYTNKRILITKIGKLALILLIPIVISALVLIPIFLLW